MKKSVFHIPAMDCPSEEQLLRMKLQDRKYIRQLGFDLEERKLSVYHEGDPDLLLADILELGLDGSMISNEQVDKLERQETGEQRRMLWIVLIINLSFFAMEMITGIFSRSMGLVADSLDMLADSFVYALSLMAVGGSGLKKNRVASAAGYFQVVLAIIGFGEIIRRFVMQQDLPDFRTMIIVSVLALLANAVCLVLLQRSKDREEAHMKASMIFTSNDVIINSGVILAGILVMKFQSGWPDLIIGSIVFVLVIRGAMRILKLGRVKG